MATKNTKNTKKLQSALLLAAFLLFFVSLSAQTRRALLVGINEYHPGQASDAACRKKFSNLYGCLYDVMAMTEILQSKYQFRPPITLINENATRANILSQFEKCLVTEAEPGDICLFYFSGHGSQVKNSKSNEPDGYDESLVPYDSYLGQKDIRYKELKRLFNQALQKNIDLTVIIDACHSGSISRGIPAHLRSRSLPADECDVAEPDHETQRPSKNGALIFTATQDFAFAYEKNIELDNESQSQGLFSWALLEVMQSAPLDESAQNIMRRVRALTAGDISHITPGALFRIDCWAAPPGNRLKIRIPVSACSFQELQRLATTLFPLQKSSRIRWVTDPTEISPSHIMFWDKHQWLLKTPGPDTIPLGKTPTLAALKKFLTGNNTAFFLQFPLAADHGAAMEAEMNRNQDAFELLHSDSDAHYVLVGRFAGETIQYAWVLPQTTVDTKVKTPLPRCTQWLSVERRDTFGDTLFELMERALKLAIIRGWQQLTTPPDDGGFPFGLALKNFNTGLLVTEGSGKLTEGESYFPVLLANRDIGKKKIEPRYVYVFIIDRDGRGTLLFPLPDQANSENRFPVAVDSNPTEIPLGKTSPFLITPPFGLDTYFLLTSNEPIDSPDDVFTFRGVRRDRTGGTMSPLKKLLLRAGLRDSGDSNVTPTQWSIERLSIQCRPK